MTSEKELWPLAYALADAPHLPIAPKEALRKARRVSPFERGVMEKAEWSRSGKRA
jgi:hypothetical protein